MRLMPWPTLKRNERIIEMWEKGMSSGQIANELCMSRSAVLGAIFRLREKGVVLRQHPAGVKVNKPKPEKKMEQVQADLMPKFLVLEVDDPEILEPEPPVGHVEAEGVRLIDLQYWHCRYIIGETSGPYTIFCGAKKGSAALCEKHHALCYIPKPVNHRKVDEPVM